MTESWLASPAFTIMMVGSLVGVATSVLGVFLVLRQNSMLTDAISHSVLLGIVVMFFIIGDSASPLLLVGAAGAGVLTVYLTELLHGSGRVKQDAAIGLVFPALFALGVLLISLYARNVHIDTHAVLLGEIGFAWLDTIEVFGVRLARSLGVMAVVTAINVLFVAVFFKELKIVTFDPALALALGFSPTLFHYLLLSLTSVTAVGAFDAVGAILVIAFFIVPPAAAYLLTDRLWLLLVYAAGIAVSASISGYYLAVLLDVSIGGMMATMTGVFLLGAFIASPRHGLVTQELRRQGQRLANAQRLLVVHLYSHENAGSSEQENAVQALQSHLHWSSAKAEQVLSRSLKQGLVSKDHSGEQLYLTERGRSLAREVLEPWHATRARA